MNNKCFYAYPDPDGETSWGGWGDKPNVIVAVQHFALTIIVLHFGNYESSFLTNQADETYSYRIVECQIYVFFFFSNYIHELRS